MSSMSEAQHGQRVGYEQDSMIKGYDVNMTLRSKGYDEYRTLRSKGYDVNRTA